MDFVARTPETWRGAGPQDVPSYTRRLTFGAALRSGCSIASAYVAPVGAAYVLLAYGLAVGGAAFFVTLAIAITGHVLVLITLTEAVSQPGAVRAHGWLRWLAADGYASFAWWFYTWAMLVILAAITVSALHYFGAGLAYRT